MGTRPAVVIGSVVVATVLAASAAVGITAARWWTSTGDAWPEEALPATTTALVVVDTEPAGRQFVGLARFGFNLVRGAESGDTSPDSPDSPDSPEPPDPSLDDAEDDLLSGGLGVESFGLDYVTDVRPWLGRRVGFALVPSDSAGAPPAVVVALPTEDEDLAAASVAKAARSGRGACTVADGWVLCSTQPLAARRASEATRDASLARDDAFVHDISLASRDTIVRVWADVAAAREAALDRAAALQRSAASLGGSPERDAAVVGEAVLAMLPQGRAVVTARFEGPHLELVGRLVSPGAVWPEAPPTPSSVGRLPVDTVGAVGARGMGRQLATVLEPVLSVLALGSVLGGEEPALPSGADLARTLDADVVLAYGGEGGAVPRVARRTDGDPGGVAGLLSGIVGSASGTPGPGRTSTTAADQAYAARVASGSGLGDTQVFRRAVPDAGRARAVAFVRVGGAGMGGAGMPLDSVGDLAGVGELSGIGGIDAVAVAVLGHGDTTVARVLVTTC